MNPIKITIAISITLTTLATTFILPILTPLIRELHLSVSQGGLMVSVGSLLMVVAAPFWGAVSDRYGRKMAIVSGFFGVFAGYALYTLAVWHGLKGSLTVTATFLSLTASRGIVCAFLPAVPAGSQALMADITTTHDRSSGMAVISAATGIGLIIGPAISGLLVMGGITSPLFATIGLCFVGGIIALVFIRKEPARSTDFGSKTSLFSAPLRPWLIAGVLTWVAIATAQISAGFYFQDKLRLGTEDAARMLSVALTIVGVGIFAVQFLQVRLLRLAPRALILAGTVMWIVELLVLLETADAISYYVAYAAIGLGSGFLLPGVMTGASLTVGQSQQGAAAGLVSAVQGIGFIVGPVASTVLYELDKALPLWCLTGLMAVLFLKFTFVPLRFAQMGLAASD
jgi:MFS family permease